MSYFPLFVKLDGESCLVVGGGRVALHKVKVLKDFGAKVTVVAETVLPELKGMEGVWCKERPFVPEDIRGRALVVAATDQVGLNHRISLLCKEERIPVNTVDQTEDCSFLFPAYIKSKDVVAAFSSGGQSPAITQYLKEQARPILTELIGDLAAQLGGLRGMVQQSVLKEERKALYRTLLQEGLTQGRTLSDEEINLATGGALEWRE